MQLMQIPHKPATHSTRKSATDSTSSRPPILDLGVFAWEPGYPVRCYLLKKLGGRLCGGNGGIVCNGILAGFAAEQVACGMCNNYAALISSNKSGCRSNTFNSFTSAAGG